MKQLDKALKLMDARMPSENEIGDIIISWYIRRPSLIQPEVVKDFFFGAKPKSMHKQDINIVVDGIKEFIDDNETYKKQAKRGEAPAGEGENDPQVWQNRISIAKKFLSKAKSMKAS